MGGKKDMKDILAVTHPLPGSSWWGHAWPPAWWSGSCLPETPSASTVHAKAHMESQCVQIIRFSQHKWTLMIAISIWQIMALIGTDCEVKLLRLLLIGPSLGQAGFAEIGFTSGFDWLHAIAVLEALRDIIVLHSHHVLNGGQSSLHGFLHLIGSEWEKYQTGCD